MPLAIVVFASAAAPIIVAATAITVTAAVSARVESDWARLHRTTDFALARLEYSALLTGSQQVVSELASVEEVCHHRSP